MTKKEVERLMAQKLQVAPAPKSDDFVKKQAIAALAKISFRDVLKENKPVLSKAERQLAYQTKKFKKGLTKK